MMSLYIYYIFKWGLNLAPFKLDKKLLALNLLDREGTKSYHKPKRFDTSKYIKINGHYQYSTKLFIQKKLSAITFIFN